ncbi:MAG: cobyric acid synthase [Labrys sp. (in: a-proteobacteria)]
MSARVLMLQGTGSDVGKSLVVAGLCRHFANQGLRVRPFKPQNMSNNAAVTADGGEIGRAQALQARAARVPLSVHMNPVLLKPQSEVGAQVIVQGRMRGTAKARAYQTMKATLLPEVLESFGRLRAEADLVLVEGAGSASEVNLRVNDIANMGFAQAAGAPVILVGDIDRGGVIAQIIGTKVAIDPQDAALVRGFIVNKMRGDPTLFDDGMRFIAERTGWEALGLLPFFRSADRLPAEDSMGLAARAQAASDSGRFTIAVPVSPHISNFDDLDPLTQEAGVSVVFVRAGAALPVCDLVILPGSKATIADLAHFRAQGWDGDLVAHVRRGGRVLGLCGGYQMLGRQVSDPDGIEGEPATVDGLGLLDVTTRLTGKKTLLSVTGRILDPAAPFRGYEMHVGETTGPGLARPFARFDDGRMDGAVSTDGRVAGCYVHGLFSDDRLRAALIGAHASDLAYEETVEATLDALARHIASHVDTARLWAIAGGD